MGTWRCPGYTPEIEVSGTQDRYPQHLEPSPLRFYRSSGLWLLQSNHLSTPPTKGQAAVHPSTANITTTPALCATLNSHPLSCRSSIIHPCPFIPHRTNHHEGRGELQPRFRAVVHLASHICCTPSGSWEASQSLPLILPSSHRTLLPATTSSLLTSSSILQILHLHLGQAGTQLGNSAWEL